MRVAINARLVVVQEVSYFAKCRILQSIGAESDIWCRAYIECFNNKSENFLFIFLFWYVDYSIRMSGTMDYIIYGGLYITTREKWVEI